MVVLRLAIVVLLLLLPVARARGQAQSDAFPFQLVDGQSFTGAVRRISDAWRIDAVTDKGEARQIVMDDLVIWGSRREASGPLTVLTDGSEISGEILRYGAKTITVGIDYENVSTNYVWEPTQIPLDRIRGVIFMMPGDLERRDALLRWMKDDAAKTDRIRLANGDALNGTVLRTEAGEPEGEDEPPPQRLRFRTGGRESSVPSSQVRAVAPNPALHRPVRKFDRPILLGFRDGSLLVARSLRQEGTQLIVTSVAGVQFKTPASRFLGMLTLIQPLQTPAVQYLSDLKPLGYRHVPFLETRWPEYGTDHSVRNGRLRASGRCFEKGLAMHTASRLAFAVPEGVSRLEAKLAVDEVVGETGSVIFRVYLDRGDGFKAVFASPILRGGQAPQALSLDISGSRRLALIVDFADRGDAGDHANWLNARFITVR